MKRALGALAVAYCATAGIAFAATPAPAPAATVYNGMTMAQLKSILTASGKTVTDIQAQSSTQDGMIRITDGPIIVLTQCPAAENGVCYEIEVTRLFSNVKPTLDAVNKWNDSNKMPEAILGSDGHLQMEYWVSTVGLTGQLLGDSIIWFEGAWQSDSSMDFWKPYMSGPST